MVSFKSQLLLTDMYMQMCAHYLCLLLCHKNEAVVVNEITVDVLSDI